MRRGKEKKQEKATIAVKELPLVRQARDLPLLVTIQHEGFWITDKNGRHSSTEDETCDRNSVMLAPNCLLYVYKVALRHLLLSMGVITPKDIDPANLVPHVKVRRDNKDAFSNYGTMQGKKFKIIEESLSSRKDFLTIELDEQRDLHCTMIYSKKIGERVDLIDAFKTVIRVLNAYPDFIRSYAMIPNFGQDYVEWWFENKHYPDDIIPPPDFKREVPQENFDNIVTTLAGSIVN